MTARVTADDGLPAGSLVVGLGVDLCEIPRIARALERHGARFVERLFQPGEIRRSKESPAYAEHVAGLFAAKEAAMKALGTGMRGIAFRELAIVRDPGGAPPPPPLLPAPRPRRAAPPRALRSSARPGRAARRVGSARDDHAHARSGRGRRRADGRAMSTLQKERAPARRSPSSTRGKIPRSSQPVLRGL